MYTNCIDLPKKLKCTPIDADWKSRLAIHWWSNNYLYSRTIEEDENYNLIKHILSFAGEMVCMAHGFDSDLKPLLEYGVFTYGEDSLIINGKPSDCHANASKYFIKNKENALIMTGYALNKDGMWRQHTWCVDKENYQILETTSERFAYYGIAYDESNSLIFSKNNT